MVDILWTNDHVDLFLRTDDIDVPQHLKCVGLRRIEWNEETKNACPRCGGTTVDTICQHGIMRGTVVRHLYQIVASCADCGKTVLHSQQSLGTAYATLVGYLPEAISTIFNIPDDATILANRGCAGTLCSFYNPPDVVLRLSHCRVVERWVPKFVALTPDEVARCSLYIKLRCEVELFPEGGIE